MFICNFLKVTPDTIWQPCSMIILSQFNFQVLLLVRLLWVMAELAQLSSRSLYLFEARTHRLTMRRTGEEDGSTKTQLPCSRGVWWIREMFFHSDSDCSRPGSCPVQQARCESALFTRGFLLCKDFLQDLSLKLSYHQSWREKTEQKTTLCWKDWKKVKKSNQREVERGSTKKYTKRIHTLYTMAMLSSIGQNWILIGWKLLLGYKFSYFLSFW